MAEATDEREQTDEEKEAAARQVVEKRKKRAIYVLAGTLAFLLISIGVAAWYFLVYNAPEKRAAREAQKPQAVEQRAIYYPLTENFIVNFDVRGRQRFLQAEVTLVLRDNAMVQVVENHLPSVRNELIMLFSGQSFTDLQTPEGKELLRQDALRVVQNLIEAETGEPGVEQLLFTGFVMQ